MRENIVLKRHTDAPRDCLPIGHRCDFVEVDGWFFFAEPDIHREGDGASVASAGDDNVALATDGIDGGSQGSVAVETPRDRRPKPGWGYSVWGCPVLMFYACLLLLQVLLSIVAFALRSLGWL